MLRINGPYVLEHERHLPPILTVAAACLTKQHALGFCSGHVGEHAANDLRPRRKSEPCRAAPTRSRHIRIAVMACRQNSGSEQWEAGPLASVSTRAMTACCRFVHGVRYYVRFLRSILRRAARTKKRRPVHCVPLPAST